MLVRFCSQTMQVILRSHRLCVELVMEGLIVNSKQNQQ